MKKTKLGFCRGELGDFDEKKKILSTSVDQKCGFLSWSEKWPSKNGPFCGGSKRVGGFCNSWCRSMICGPKCTQRMCFHLVKPSQSYHGPLKKYEFLKFCHLAKNSPFFTHFGLFLKGKYVQNVIFSKFDHWKLKVRYLQNYSWYENFKDMVN